MGKKEEPATGYFDVRNKDINDIKATLSVCEYSSCGSQNEEVSIDFAGRFTFFFLL